MMVSVISPLSSAFLADAFKTSITNPGGIPITRAAIFLIKESLTFSFKFLLTFLRITLISIILSSWLRPGM